MMASPLSILRFLLVILIISISTYSLDCAEVNITVSNVPKILDLVERLNNPEGTNATFTCSIGSGELVGLTYEWRKDDVLLNPANNPKLRIVTPAENYQSVLRVINLVPTDAGVYSCRAKNIYGQDKVSTRLSVKVQLKWLAEPRNKFQVSVGKSLQVPCLADGFPKPTIEWNKVSGESGARYLGPELKFANIQQEDAGVYECRARNGVEKDLVSRTEIEVLGKYRSR